ncbi:MAG: 30S ribosomal protein S9 [Rickettsiales bacterium]
MQENQNKPDQADKKTSNFSSTKPAYSKNIDTIDTTNKALDTTNKALKNNFKTNSFVKRDEVKNNDNTNTNNVKKVFKPKSSFVTNKDSDKKPFKNFNKTDNKFNSNFQNKKEFSTNNKFTKPEFAKKSFVKKIVPKANVEKIKIKLDSAIHGFYGTGRRKNSIAKVRIYKSEANNGNFIINNKTVSEYFTRITNQVKLLKILDLLNIHGKFNIKCTVLGGGLTGQVGAIQLGLARALCEYNLDYRPTLKANNMLTRDSRMVLSKKIDHVKSRKRRAFVKR